MVQFIDGLMADAEEPTGGPEDADSDEDHASEEEASASDDDMEDDDE